MIRSFADKKTADFAQGRRVAAFHGIVRQATKRLRILDNADDLTTLRALPSNRLEALAGDRAGQYSIRINQQWRICFRFQDGDAYDVEIVDYHR